ncbi:MFS multidrug transporter-like protein [Rhizodiscina lignyota]|uniref:MFS multidrug transporter-like protein n=1 Tax=Rhizodiscina lignyota TaxID=1504668 RepID=A0A9P4IN69_9PEZI|nr:MFS multidrug transporter-like protein [Rhizodiscina lignyota]
MKSSFSVDVVEKGKVGRKGSIPNAEGPDDPYKWSLLNKLYHTAISSIFCFTVTIASSIYMPARNSIIERFNVSLTIAILPYSFYVFGQALGPLLAAPLSENFGRRGTYVPCMLLFGLFTLGAGLSQSIASLTICRFFAGVFGSPVLSVSAGTMADIWTPQQRPIPLATLTMIPFLGPSLGPLISGFVIPATSWRWSQWIICILAATSLLFALGMKETNKQVILARHAHKIGLLNVLMTSTLLRPWKMFFSEIIVGSLAFYIGIVFAIYYALFAAFPYIFITQYGFDLGAQGLTFLGLAAGNIIAFLYTLLRIRITKGKIIKAMKEGKMVKFPPENRLVTALHGTILVPIGLFWVGWTARSSVHWIVCISGSAFFAAGNFLVFTAYATYVVEVYGPLVGASATATVAMLRSLLGGAFPLFTIQMYERFGIGPATSLLGGIVLLLTPAPWLLYKFGPEVRAKSRYIPST